MPFVDNTNSEIPAGGLAPQTPEQLTITPDRDFSDLTKIAFDQNTSVGQIGNAAGYAWQWSHDVDHTPDLSFDPGSADNITGYEDMFHLLGTARNRSEFDYFKARIDKERSDQGELAAAGGRGVLAALAAGAADPINMIPVTGAKNVYEAGSIMRGLAQGAVAGAVTGVVGEAINQATRVTPTIEDSLINIGGATVLVGALGAAGGAVEDAARAGELAIRGKKIQGMNDIAGAMADEAEAYADRMAMQDGGSVGAAAVPRTTMEQETLVPASILPNAVADRLPDRVQKSLDLTRNGLTEQDPTLRLATSESIEARRIIEQMADSPLMRQKNLEGIASPVPVDSLLRQHEANLELLNPEVFDMYSQYRRGRPARAGDAIIGGVRDLVARPADNKLTFSEFRQEVGKAMARNDSHQIPEVAQAAKRYREQIFDPLKERAINQGLLPPEVEPKTAASYISRLYNKEKIIAQRPEFERRITEWLKSTNTDVTERFDNFSKQAEISKATIAQHAPALDDARKRLAEIRPKDTETRKQHIALKREVAVLDKQMKRAQGQAEKAAARVQKLTPAEATADFAKAIRDLKKGVPKKERPQTLSEWIKSKGGIKDEGGDLAALAPGKGIINNKSGMSLDDAALYAQELGFFPQSNLENRITINDLLDALDGDLKGYSPVYRASDYEAVAYADYLTSLDEELTKAGIDINKLTPAQIEAKMAGREVGPGDSAAARARMREAEFTQRRAGDNVDKIKAEADRRQKRFDRVSADRESYTAQVRSLQQEIDDLARIIEVNSGKAERFGKLAQDVHYIAGASEDDLRLISREITDGLIGHAPGRLAYDGVPVTRGPLKERTLLIPDAKIEEFLDRDIFRVARRYNHTMATDLELQKAFGSADMRHQITKINDDYESLRLEAARKFKVDDKTLAAGKDLPEDLQKELKRLDTQQKKDIRDVEGVRDRIRGTYGLPNNPQGLASRAFRVAKGVNFMRLMGGVTLASFPDVARPVMIHGLMRSFSDGIVPMVKNFKQFKLSAGEAKLAGTALDMITNDRALALAGLDDAWMQTSKLERGITSLTDNYKFVSLIAPWTAAMKQLSAVITQTRSLEAIEAMAKGGKLAAGEVARLAQFGIDESMGRRIWAQVSKHGVKEDGIHWANTNAWTDATAAATYRSALQREVDKIIVTPGQDKPLFMSTDMGGALLQFKSFAFASTQRMLISGLQQRDLAALNGAVLSTALGMVSYWSKTDHDKLSDKPQKWLVEGIDRSGALAWFMDVNNTMEKVTGYGLNPSLGLPAPSRYASRDAASAVFGPTYGLVFGTLLPAISAVSRGDATAADVHKLRQMLPYQNLFYIRGLFDKAEQGATRAFGIPEKK